MNNNTMSMIFIGILFFLMLSSLYFLFRNQRVAQEKMRVINIASSRAKIAIDKGDLNWQRYYDEIDKYSYNEMVWKFWKPVKSFYKEF